MRRELVACRGGASEGAVRDHAAESDRWQIEFPLFFGLQRDPLRIFADETISNRS
jgi:hypothetical protein